ncbi:hypothetical protein JCM8547_006106 [Rhodosporidiobolus lusitaniae]
MGKVRHRKRTRDARVAAAAAPLKGAPSSTLNGDNAAPLAADAQAGGKKVGKKEQEVSTLLDKFRSTESRDRVWAASTLSSLLLALPPVQQRLLLSKNLIGLLIERLTLPVPPSSASSPPAPPPSDDLTTSIESLGSLRNLAVSSPPHILSEMHNKRLLLPLLSIHVPLLTAYLPAVLGPAPEKVKPNLPATPAERERVDLLNEAQETLRAGYWDWAENVLVLLWSLAESNTKILAALNAHAGAIVGLCVGFLSEERLGIEKKGGAGGEEDGMEVEGAGKKGKKDKKGKKSAGAKVPLFVAVAAAQTLHAFVSSNPAAHSSLLSSSTGPGTYSFSPSLSSLLSLLLTPSPPTSSPSFSATSSTASQVQDDWTQLRVLAFGTLLELAKSRSKRRDVESVRETLRGEEAQGVLLELVGGASGEGVLETAAQEGKKAAGEIDPTALPSSHPPANSPAYTLQSLERRAQTLLLALEVLSEWLASGVPNSAALAGGAAAEEEEDGMMGGEDEEEEWGGISMDVEEGDVAMDEDDDEEEDPDKAEGIVRKTLPGEGEEEAMLDDLAAVAESESTDDDNDDDDTTPKKKAIKLLAGSLPLQLLSLSRPTSLAFLPSTSFASPLSSKSEAAASSSLLSTSASDAALLPSALVPLSEALTTVAVRAIEALNNLYVTLAKAGKGKRRSVEGEVQRVFETTLELMLGALDASTTKLPSAEPVAATGKKGKKGGAGAGGGAGGEEEVEEAEERRMEVVMAGAGVVWGCVRLGLDSEREGEQLTISPSVTPFLLTRVFPSPFAAAPTPAGEAIRVRVLGALGWLGRRRGVGVEENKAIGSSLLSLLPLPSTPSPSSAVATAASTPDILLQAIDSFIDLYADEEREYDVPVFRGGGLLEGVEERVKGVRAAIKKIDRNKFPDLRARADGALENLVAFAGYRRDVVKQSKARR